MWWYKISVISVDDKGTYGIGIVFLLPTFVMGENAAFQGAVSEHKDVILLPFKFMNSLNSISGHKG